VRNWQQLAVRNNAALCDAVCRTHGLDPRFERAMWTSAVRTPMFYPDAITLGPELSLERLLARIDNSPGASVKDSYAALDLRGHGYDVLFEARWIVAEPAPAEGVTGDWVVVATPDAFRAWEAAWRGDDGPRDVLLARLLEHDHVTVIAMYDGDRVIGGAILNRSDDVIGISNVFTPDPADWSHLRSFVNARHPDLPLVGYESDAALDAARASGFVDVGSLRVWLHEAHTG
jgi:hypothetical protein